MAISRYPRTGQRIAPMTLREILAAPIPSGLLPRTAGRFEKLSDLDESVWLQASPIACKVLAEYVVDEVRRNLHRLPVEVRLLQLSAISSQIPLRALDLKFAHTTVSKSGLERTSQAKRVSATF